MAKQTLNHEFDQLAVRNKEIVDRREFVLEAHASAIFLREEIPASSVARGMLREISHVHSSGDHSVHVTLSPRDCIKVLDADLPIIEIIQASVNYLSDSQTEE